MATSLAQLVRSSTLKWLDMGRGGEGFESKWRQFTTFYYKVISFQKKKKRTIM